MDVNMDRRVLRSNKMNAPVTNSTPKTVGLSARSNIHNHTVSPITADSDDEINDSTTSEDESVDETTDSYFVKEKSIQSNELGADRRPLHELRSERIQLNKSNDNSYEVQHLYIAIGIFVALISLVTSLVTGVSLFAKDSERSNSTLTLKHLRTSFPSQLPDTWIDFASGVNETKHFNKPSVFVVLHEESTEATLHSLLNEMANYASCVLNQNCDVKPIVVTSDSLVKETKGRDYGHILVTYKPLLQERAIFVLFDFDELPGQLAQAFHSMCDEFTPLVSKTVYFFTMKAVESKQGESNLALVERILRSKWSDLNDDVFYPLVTRVSSMVLRVVPENRL